MRPRLLLAVLGLACATPVLAAGADYSLTVEGIGRTTGAGPVYVKVRSSADSDGDGLGDAAVLRLQCSGAQLAAAALRSDVRSPRDAASGMASGKRTHHPVTFVKEWGPSTPQFRELLPRIRVSSVPSARADAEGWMPVSMAGADGLCPAAEAARATINTSRSNIKNN